MYLILAAVAVVGGLAMNAAQKWLNEDWREVSTCQTTYWTCESTIQGRPRIVVVSGSKPTFTSEAKACEEYRAFESAMRRAMFNCNTGSNVLGGTCREVETECWLPTKEDRH
jgi:hypothetical protein